MARLLGNIKPVRTSDVVFPLSVEQYHEMVRVGVLSDDDPVELLEGVLVFHMPKSPLHRYLTRAVFEAISAILPADWHCQMQEPVTLHDGEPEPDISVVRGKPADYRAIHPGAGDVAIVMEVSDRTLDRDRGVKLRSYARAGIPEYWIIDLPNRCIDVLRQPTGVADDAHYHRSTRYAAGQIVPVDLSGMPIGSLDTRLLFE